MHFNYIVLLLPLLAAQATASTPEPSIELPPIVLGQGEQRLLRVPGLKRYTLGGSALRAKALDGGQSLLVKGVLPGNSDLWVFKKDGPAEHRAVRVERVSQPETSAALEKALGHLDETEVLIAGPGVVLRGPVRTLRESAKVQAVVQNFKKEVKDETEATEDLAATAEKQLGQWMQTTPAAKALKLERLGRALFVRGSLERPSQLPVVEAALRRIYPQTVVEIDSLPDATPTVYFRVFLLELKKSRFHSLGLSWPSLQEGAFRVTTGAIQDLLSLDVALNALEGDGSLKILSNPELVVRAPGEAELFAGGELPIRTKTQHTATVVWKKHGLSLRLKVAQSVGERVRLEIFTEMSQLDPTMTQDDIPSLHANRMSTQVDARYGKPLLLSGLLAQNTRAHARGLPFLRSIPVLGALFGSEDYLQERSELVAILLPASAPPENPMSRLARASPRGPAPPPRSWISPAQERALKESEDWPWNALQ